MTQAMLSTLADCQLLEEAAGGKGLGRMKVRLRQFGVMSQRSARFYPAALAQEFCDKINDRCRQNKYTGRVTHPDAGGKKDAAARGNWSPAMIGWKGESARVVYEGDMPVVEVDGVLADNDAGRTLKSLADIDVDLSVSTTTRGKSILDEKLGKYVVQGGPGLLPLHADFVGEGAFEANAVMEEAALETALGYGDAEISGDTPAANTTPTIKENPKMDDAIKTPEALAQAYPGLTDLIKRNAVDAARADMDAKTQERIDALTETHKKEADAARSKLDNITAKLSDVSAEKNKAESEAERLAGELAKANDALKVHEAKAKDAENKSALRTEIETALAGKPSAAYVKNVLTADFAEAAGVDSKSIDLADALLEEAAGDIEVAKANFARAARIAERGFKAGSGINPNPKVEADALRNAVVVTDAPVADATTTASADDPYKAEAIEKIKNRAR